MDFTVSVAQTLLMPSSSILPAGPLSLALAIACSTGGEGSSGGAPTTGDLPTSTEPGSSSAPSEGSGAAGSWGMEGNGATDGGSGGASAGTGGNGATGGGAGETGLGGGLTGTAGTGASGGSGGAPSEGGDARFFPSSLDVRNLNGEGKAVNVIASTLVETPDGPELYAALENSGDMMACDGAVSFELFDQTEVSVGSWIGGLYSTQLFRRDDGEGGLVSCVGPGGLAMTVLTDLPDDLPIDELGTALYQLTYFDAAILPFGLVPVEDVTVDGVQSVGDSSGFRFTGTLQNGLEVPIGDAAVTIFTLNDMGRPVGVGGGSAAEEIPAGGSWSFETTAVQELGVDHVAFPSGVVEFRP